MQGCPTKIILVFFCYCIVSLFFFFCWFFSCTFGFFIDSKFKFVSNSYYVFLLLWMTMKFGLFCHFLCVNTTFLSNWTHTFYLGSWKLICKHQCWLGIYFWLGINQGINQGIGCPNRRAWMDEKNKQYLTMASFSSSIHMSCPYLDKMLCFAKCQDALVGQTSTITHQCKASRFRVRN